MTENDNINILLALSKYAFLPSRVIQKTDGIIRGILADISDRLGIGNEFESIDNDTKLEIIGEWCDIIIYNLRESGKGEV